MSGDQRGVFARLLVMSSVKRIDRAVLAARLGMSYGRFASLVSGHPRAVLMQRECSTIAEVFGVPQNHSEIMRLRAMAPQDG